MSVQGASYRVTWWGMALLLVSSMQEVSTTVANFFSETATSFEEPGELLGVPGTQSTLYARSECCAGHGLTSVVGHFSPAIAFVKARLDFSHHLELCKAAITV